MLSRAAFLDRDGVINVDHGYTYRVDAFEFVPGVLQAAATLAALGFKLVVVTNQSGIGRGLYTDADFQALTHWMCDQFTAAGAPLAGVYWCPHHPTDAIGAHRRDCDCRKPKPGMLLQAARELDLDLGASVMFGDKRSDLQAAQAAGLRERVLLGMNGLALPAPDEDGDLATARFRTLADAAHWIASRHQDRLD